MRPNSSHQAFLRAYMIGSDGQLHSTGNLLAGTGLNPDGSEIGATATDSTGAVHSQLATWGLLKASAAHFLGIQLQDGDVNSVPLLATDAYGNLILGPHGLAQLVVTWTSGLNAGKQGLVEGNLLNPVITGNSNDLNAQGFTEIATDPVTGDKYVALTTGGGFIDDKNVAADPFDPVSGTRFSTDPVTHVTSVVPYQRQPAEPALCGGRRPVEREPGLTAVQELFHAEHDRLVGQIEQTVQDNLNNGDISFASNWVLPGVVLTPGVAIQANQWDGERLFQAAKFGTETEYQHLVFEEFARMVAPAIHPAGGVNIHIDPAITSEFANVVYRFGHSMLDENLNVYQMDANGRPIMDRSTRSTPTALRCSTPPATRSSSASSRASRRKA